VSLRRYRRTADGPLCADCKRTVKAAYFRSYYLARKAVILQKNRQWAKDNPGRIAERRSVQREAKRALSRTCLDCEAVVVRALRCRRCRQRFRYASDPRYRTARLAASDRWLTKRRTTVTG